MSVRRTTENRLTLYRQCWICGKWFWTTAASPWMRQIQNVGGKKQKTCYFCSSACKEESYKMPHHGKGRLNKEEKSRARRHTPDENRAYYLAHAEEIKARKRAKYQADPEPFLAANRYNRAKRKALKEANGMKRGIIFRGNRMDNGEWAEGSLVRKISGDGFWIDKSFQAKTPKVHSIDPTTVGQYTGLNDKNGKRIFEGDIISAKNEIGEIYRFKVVFGKRGGVENVKHDVGCIGFYFEEITGKIPVNLMLISGPLYWINAYECEVIGNIYDNPDLLEGTA